MKDHYPEKLSAYVQIINAIRLKKGESKRLVSYN